MGIGKRLIDLARANINALLDKAGAPPEGLEGLSDEQLEAELERRRERREREEVERREREAAERAARERAAQRAFEAMKARAASGRTGAKRTAKSETRRPPPVFGTGMSEKKLRELYAQLEVPYGASFDEVKQSFRRLMRKYHPDLHTGNPKKHQAATQLSMTLTQAYRELEAHLNKK